MDIPTFIQTLSIQYRYTSFTFGVNLDGLSNDDALRQPESGGNCLNWVAGHVVGSRAGTLEILGQKPSFKADKYARYRRGSAAVTDANGAVPLSEMVADFASTNEGLAAGLAALTATTLAGKAPFSPGNRDDETVGSLLAGLVFHEAYHIGQLGVLRRMAGQVGAIK